MIKFLKTILGRKDYQSDPDNKKLLRLLEVYRQKDGKHETYKDVAEELLYGNCFLLLPTHNDSITQGLGEWETTKEATTLQLTSVVNLDGLKALAAFTDEQALLNWTKEQTKYTGLSAKDVLKLCEEIGIDRVVINSGAPNMFVLERNRENIKKVVIEQDTTVQIGTPNQPLDNKIIAKLTTQFKNVATIEEVFQYGQTKDNEFSIVLAFKMSVYSDNAKTAALNAVQSAFENEKIDQLIDILFLEEMEWYNAAKDVQDSLVYLRTR